MPSAIEITGLVTAAPSTATDPAGLKTTIDLGASKQAAHHVAGAVPVAHLVGAPLPLLGVAAATTVILRAVDAAALVAVLSSALGADQVIPFAGLLAIEAPTATPFTAVRVYGTGELEYAIAGS